MDKLARWLGVTSVFHNVGLFIAPIFAGWARDQIGSYNVVLLTFAPMFVASAIFFALARRPTLPVSQKQPALHL